MEPPREESCSWSHSQSRGRVHSLVDKCPHLLCLLARSFHLHRMGDAEKGHRVSYQKLQAPFITFTQTISNAKYSGGFVPSCVPSGVDVTKQYFRLASWGWTKFCTECSEGKQEQFPPFPYLQEHFWLFKKRNRNEGTESRSGKNSTRADSTT